jgi:hypothetical protein
MKPFTSAWVADVLAAHRADQVPESAVVAAFALVGFMNFNDRTVKAAQPRIASSLGCSERHLRRLMAPLVSAGLVKRVRDRGEDGRLGRNTLTLTTLDHRTQLGTIMSGGPSDIARHSNHRTRSGTNVAGQYLEPSNEPVVRTTNEGNGTKVPASWADTGSFGQTLAKNLAKTDASEAETNLIAERLRPAFDAGRVKPSTPVVAEELRRVREEDKAAARDAEAERQRLLDEKALEPLQDWCRETHRDADKREYHPNGLCWECEQNRLGAAACALFVAARDTAQIVNEVIEREGAMVHEQAG